MDKVKHILCFFLLSCVEFEAPFEREKFENEWWEIQEYPVCFNFHESGTLFSYQPQEIQVGHWRQLIDEGQWEYHIPNEYSVLDNFQTDLFWGKTRNLEVFSNLKNNLLRVIVPVSETLNVIQKLKKYEINYFLDWGGNLIWLELEQISLKILREIKEITNTSIKLAVKSVKKIISTSVDKSKLDNLFEKNLKETKTALKKINS